MKGVKTTVFERDRGRAADLAAARLEGKVLLGRIERDAIAKSGRPACPNCEDGMSLRSGGRGFFWGCPSYPFCAGTRELA